MTEKGMDMDYGDAFKDMPEAYSDYVMSSIARNVESEQSEADRARADGKPRWIYDAVLGWQYVIILYEDN